MKFLLPVIFLVNILFLNLAMCNAQSDSTIIRLIDSANYYCSTNNDLALKFGKEALNRSDDEITKAKACQQLGMIFKHWKHLDSALIFLHQSAEIFDSLIQHNNTLKQELPGLLSMSYNELAEIHADNLSPRKALNYNDKALETGMKYNLSARLVYAYLTRSKIYYSMELPDSARLACLKGLQLSLKEGNNDLTGRLYNNIGAIFYNQQEWDSCIYYFEKAYEFKKGCSSDKELVPTLNNLGLINSIKKNYHKAIQYLHDADSLSQKNNLTLSRAISLYYQVTTYLDMKKYDEAKKAFEVYDEVSSEYYDLEKKKQIEELETKYQTAQKENEIKSLQKDNEIKDQKVRSKNRLLLLFLALSLLIIALVYFYLKWSRLKHLSIQDELKIKNLQIEQKMLRSQMNPHFIYNSLNSIQSFISENENYQAEKYLARFAKLMRGILEHSRLDFVLLEDELEILEIYIELEKLRFNSKFDYKITVDEEIESDYIKIPPMIIQPFVENSIKHGFKNENNGFIHIDIKLSNDLIICTVEDNGIGRKASIEGLNSEKHKSLGMDITRDRLSKISLLGGLIAKYRIIDLYEGEEARGTKVIIDLPYREM